MKEITSFRGNYFFLSNFYPHPVLYKGILYPSSEHAYISAKTDDIDIKKEVSKIQSPHKAKNYGRSIVLKNGWDMIKIDVMREILEIKFSDDEMYSMLQSTSPNILIEGNTWGDVFWGQCPIGVGKNHLGKILMDLRDHNMWKLLKK